MLAANGCHGMGHHATRHLPEHLPMSLSDDELYTRWQTAYDAWERSKGTDVAALQMLWTAEDAMLERGIAPPKAISPVINHGNEETSNV
jgi:hypothetical protein